MPPYLAGIFTAFSEPVLHAWANVVDNYFSNAVFSRLSTLLFFGTVLNLVFLPFVAVVSPPQTLPYGLLAVVFVISLINIGYQFPYYWALRHADTSVVSSLFFLGFVFVPVLAFFVVGERLAVSQYAGFALIVIAAMSLTLDLKQFRLNRAFFLMLGVSLALAVQAVLYKFVFEAGASWGSVVTALAVFDIFISGAIMLSVNSLQQVRDDFARIKKHLKLFFLQQFLEWGGTAGGSFAVSVLPATVARGIVTTQPFFVLLYALIFGRAFPHMFKELVDRGAVVKKTLLFVLILLGTILVVAGSSTIDAYL